MPRAPRVTEPGVACHLLNRRVMRWRDGAMVLRWTASALLASEKSFRRLMGCNQLWMLEACLNESQGDETMDRRKKVG